MEFLIKVLYFIVSISLLTSLKCCLVESSVQPQLIIFYHSLGLPWWLSGKESFCHCRRYGFNPWVRKIPWRRKWQPTPVFLSGESHGQRSLAGYNPWGHQRVGHDLATKQPLAKYHVCAKYFAYSISITRLCFSLSIPVSGKATGNPVSQGPALAGPDSCTGPSWPQCTALYSTVLFSVHAGKTLSPCSKQGNVLKTATLCLYVNSSFMLLLFLYGTDIIYQSNFPLPILPKLWDSPLWHWIIMFQPKHVHSLGVHLFKGTFCKFLIQFTTEKESLIHRAY